MFELQAFHRKLAADHDGWPLDANPSPVEFGGAEQAFARRADDTVAGGVEHFDDLATFDNRVRDEDVLAKASRDALSNSRFAIAGRSVDEHAFAGIDCRTELAEHVRFDVDIRKRPFELLPPRPFRRNGLGMDGADVVFERHWRWADVRTFA